MHAHTGRPRCQGGPCWRPSTPSALLCWHLAQRGCAAGDRRAVSALVHQDNPQRYAPWRESRHKYRSWYVPFRGQVRTAGSLHALMTSRVCVCMCVCVCVCLCVCVRTHVTPQQPRNLCCQFPRVQTRSCVCMCVYIYVPTGASTQPTGPLLSVPKGSELLALSREALVAYLLLERHGALKVRVHTHMHSLGLSLPHAVHHVTSIGQSPCSC